MQIKTTSYQNILESLCGVLELDEQTVMRIIGTGYEMFQHDHKVLVMDDLYDYFIDVAKHYLKQTIDKVSFYHVSRRLDDANNYGLSLVEVLAGDSSLSRYLKNYGLTFKYDQGIELHVNGVKVEIREPKYNSYMKYRFSGDYAFKGYAFGDQLENNEIVGIVEGGPEFFGHLFNYIDNDDEIIDHFMEQSKLYQFEYLVPIEDIYFDNYEELSNKEKQLHLIAKALQRLYFYQYDPSFVKSDEDNPIIKMVDDKKLLSRHLVDKTEL